MLRYKSSDIINKALEIAQVGNADIPYDTMIMLLDQEYRKLQDDLVRSKRSGIVKKAELVKNTDQPIDGPYNVWRLPKDCNRVVRIVQQTPWSERELNENAVIGADNYKQEFDIIKTYNAGPLFVEYVPIWGTPVMTMPQKELPIGTLLWKRGMTWQLVNNIVFVSDGTTIELPADFKSIKAIDDKIFYNTEDGIYDLNHNLLLAGDFSYFDYDARADQFYTDQPNFVRRFVSKDVFYVYDHGTLTIQDSAGNTNAVIKEGLAGVLPVNIGFVTKETFSDEPPLYVMRTFDNKEWILNIKEDPESGWCDEKTGYGLIGKNTLYGYFPDTEFEFYQTVFWDVMITRMAIKILSYLGLAPSGQMMLMQQAESQAFLQNVRSHSYARIKNLRENR